MKNPRTKGRKPPTLAGLKKRAWKLLSEVIRREAVDRDAGCESCYTCGATDWWKRMQAGHAIGGRGGAVLFDEEIIRPQCVRCNIMLKGNYPVFIHRLIREKADGQFHATAYPEAEALTWWEQKLLSAKQIKKWSRSELLEKIDSYKERLKALDLS